MEKLKLSAVSKAVLESRYLKRDKDGNPDEEPEDMLMRVAQNIAEAEENYKDGNKEEAKGRFYNLMLSRRFMPNSPTLMNAGRDLQQLSACFVLPVEDSMNEIFDSVKNAALIHKSGGGTGFSFSRLRPKNDRVLSTSGVSSGPVSFMKVFNSATEIIKQGGTRRGANMGILRVDHPDILDFISCKEDLKELNNFNISVAITDEFMTALKERRNYNLINPRDKSIYKEESAEDVFNLIVRHAWQSGEPGVVFIDRVNAENPTPEVGEIESTNPCGEQPLLPYEACNLGSINLSLFVKDDGIDYDYLRETVHDSIHFLDNVIDMNRYPIDAIRDMVMANRKVGLGVMGFADMLYKLGISYDSEEAERYAANVMKFIQEEARAKSAELAEKRGVFPNYEKSTFKEQGIKLRNATLTTIAPTGTISMISGTSGGVEPVFALAFIRNVLDGKELYEVNPVLEETAKEHDFYSDDLLKELSEKGSIKHIDGIDDKWKKVFRTSHDVSPEWHIRIQAAFQKYTDNAVSKTVNFAKNASVEDVKEAYTFAYELGCKGLTVYRDGSRDEQVLNIGKVNRKEEGGEAEEHEEVEVREEVIVAGHVKPRPRPKATHGSTLKIPTACGNLYVTINEDEYGLCEVFATIGKSGGCASSQAEGISRLLSLTLRGGLDVDSVVKQLRGIRCTSPIWSDGEMVLSCPDAIGRALELYQRGKEELSNKNAEAKQQAYIKTKTPAKKISSGKAGVCPDCGADLEISEGCKTCRSCGYSKCG